MEDEYNLSNIIGKRLEAALGELGDLLWAYVVLSKKDIACIFGVTNYPSEWVKKYQEQGLQYIDPVVLTARNRLTPFAWDEQIMADAGLHFPELFEQAREFGVTHGYTFVLHDYNDNLVTLSFAFSAEQKMEATQALTERKGDISVLLASIHESYLALSPLSAKNAAALERNARFTDRENEILYWASVGKTYQETAMILGIKTGTIKFHMSNVVTKLGVTNARHAVRLGMELRLIKPVEY